MSWSDIQVTGLLGLGKGIGSYIVQARQAKSDKKWKAYNNKMTQLQNAVNQDNITINENMAVERNVREQYALRLSAYKTNASATVAAAAVGAEGNSVDRVMADLARNESRAQTTLARDFKFQMQGFNAQRDSSRMQTAMQMDYTQIPKPNLAATLLETSADAASKWWESKL